MMLALRFIAVVLLLRSTSALAAEPGPLEFPPAPVPVEQVVSKMKLPPGFQASLFAGEPELVQPIAFTFDDRGRLWVAECLSYPKWSKDGTGRDRISIYEDTDGDGRHDRKTVFADDLANVSGLEYGFGGVWICSLPKLLFLPDRDGDDRPDGPPQTVLDGWDENCRHNVFNGLAWGPDGWLYGLNGILSRSAVGKPGTPDERRVKFDCGVWRVHPVRHDFEVVAWGTTNPWGLDWDDYGEMFITNCVIKHLFHVTPGGHYERMFGADPNPHTYGLLQSCADHIHWAGGHWTDSRGGQGAHSDAGGGHAHSGCSIYLGDDFPPEYRNNVFLCNLHGNRLNRDRLEPHASGYVARHAPDFLFAGDPWFRGLNVKYGPDGGLYVSDWCDTGECHNYEVADVTNGRIVKIVYEERNARKDERRAGSAGDRSAPFNLVKLSDAELVDLQQHRNDWWVRHARRVLQERAVAKGLDPQVPALLRKQFAAVKSVPARLRSVWALEAIGALGDADLLTLLADRDATLRAWGVALAGERREPAPPIVVELVKLAQLDPSPKVRLRLASAAQQLSPRTAVLIAAELARHVEDADDPQLPLMIWYAIEGATSADLDSPEAAASDGVERASLPVLRAAKIPLLRRLIARHVVLTAGSEAADATPRRIDRLLATAIPLGDDVAADVGRGVLEALAGIRSVKPPAAWIEHFAALSVSPNTAARDAAFELGVLFDDAAVIDRLTATVADSAAETTWRRRAIELLARKREARLLPRLTALLDDAVLRGDALRALAFYDDPQVAQSILSRFARFNDAERAEALETLVARPAYALALLDAVATGTIDRRDVPSRTALELAKLKDKRVGEKLKQVWGAVRPTSQARLEQAARIKRLLSSEALGGADLAAGRTLYAKTCAACHKLFDEGGAIGPELTGSQRFNLDYLLENVLDPSAKVGRLYFVTVFELDDGRVVQGIVIDENERGITVQTTTQKLTIAKADVASREETKTSMMPEGLFDRLSETELRDLTAYLMRK